MQYVPLKKIPAAHMLLTGLFCNLCTWSNTNSFYFNLKHLKLQPKFIYNISHELFKHKSSTFKKRSFAK